MDGIIVANLMNHFDGGSIRNVDILINHHWLVDRVECPILIDEIKASRQLTILTIIVGWRVGQAFENYILFCSHVLEFKFGRMIS